MASSLRLLAVLLDFLLKLTEPATPTTTTTLRMIAV